MTEAARITRLAYIPNVGSSSSLSNCLTSFRDVKMTSQASWKRWIRGHSIITPSQGVYLFQINYPVFFGLLFEGISLGPSISRFWSKYLFEFLFSLFCSCKWSVLKEKVMLWRHEKMLCWHPLDLDDLCCQCSASFDMKLARMGSGTVVSGEGILYQSLAQM